MPGFELVGPEEQAAVNEVFEKAGGVLFPMDSMCYGMAASKWWSSSEGLRTPSGCAMRKL